MNISGISSFDFRCGLLVFVASVLAAHVLLPALDKTTLFPLNQWRLFEGYKTGSPEFDLVYQVDGRSRLASHDSLIEDSGVRFDAWSIARAIGFSLADETRTRSLASSLKFRLAQENMTAVAVVQLTAPLSEFILMDNETALSKVGEVYRFE